MKIAITAFGTDENAKLDLRFGRAAYFMVYDDQTAAWSHADNKQNLEAVQGAGIQAAQHIRNLGAEILITGNVGPKAFKVLSANGIKVYNAGNFTVKEALAAFENRLLPELTQANVEGHWV